MVIFSVVGFLNCTQEITNLKLLYFLLASLSLSSEGRRRTAGEEAEKARSQRETEGKIGHLHLNKSNLNLQGVTFILKLGFTWFCLYQNVSWDLSKFCPNPACHSRIGQTAEQQESKSTSVNLNYPG